jgi:hypothetical protein
MQDCLKNQSTIFDKNDTIESIITRQLFHFGRFDDHYNDRSNGLKFISVYSDALPCNCPRLFQ